MASINKYVTAKGLNRWKIQYYTGNISPKTGKPEKLSKAFANCKDALLFKNKVEAELLENEHLAPASRYTFKFVYDKWFKFKQLGDVTESTMNQIESNFRLHILPTLGKLALDKITTEMLEELVQNWLDRPKPLTKYRMLFGRVKSVLQYAVHMKWLGSNPANAVLLPSVNFDKKDMLDNFLEVDDLITFLSCAKENLNTYQYVYLHLIALTGGRRGEPLALTWSDIDFENCKIRISKTIAEDNRLSINLPKNKKVHTISVDRDTMNLLLKWKNEQSLWLELQGINKIDEFTLKTLREWGPDSPRWTDGAVEVDNKQLLFPNAKNAFQQPQRADDWMRRIIRLSGVKKITLHGLRHTFVTLGASVFSLKAAQVQLGHRSERTTRGMYQGITRQESGETAQKYADMLQNASEKPRSTQK